MLTPCLCGGSKGSSPCRVQPRRLHKCAGVGLFPRGHLEPLAAPVWLGAVSPARRRLALLQRGAAFQSGPRKLRACCFASG